MQKWRLTLMSATTSAKSCCTVMVNDIDIHIHIHIDMAVHAEATTRMGCSVGNYPVSKAPDSRGLGHTALHQ